MKHFSSHMLPNRPNFLGRKFIPTPFLMQKKNLGNKIVGKAKIHSEIKVCNH